VPVGTWPLPADPADPAVRPGVAAWLRWGVAAPDPGCAWHDAASGVVALVRHRRAYGTGLVVVDPAGDPRHVDAVVDVVRHVGGASGADFVTVERGPWARALAGALEGLSAPAEWDWMWTTTAPPAVPAESRVVPLGAEDHAAIAALLAAASPRHSAEPGETAVRGWLGVRGPDGGLLACGADYEAVPGVPLLASIAVAAAARGQGLGAAVTARLTRDALGAGAAAVTIDLYADNPAARRLYERLGYRMALNFASSRFEAGAGLAEGSAR
jgi:ribosomal protein S18 acetylase RimI-like enzyme